MQNRINHLLDASTEIRYLKIIKMYLDLLLRVKQWMITSYFEITPDRLNRAWKELAHKIFDHS